MKQYLGFSYELKDIDATKGIVQFYANAFNNKDSDSDISLHGSFKKTLRERGKKLRHFKNHNPTQMPGVVISAKEDAFGLLIESQLILDTQLGKETFAEYKALADAKKNMEHSIGVNAINYTIDEKKGIRQVAEWQLWEVSTLNMWGANPDASTQNIKSISDLSREDLEIELMLCKGLLNIETYDDLKLEDLEKQKNYIEAVLRAVLEKEQHSESNTLMTENMNYLFKTLKDGRERI